MTAKIISTEKLIEKMAVPFERLMELIPVNQREDQFLKRLLAVRLKLDGENQTRAYIIKKLQDASACGYSDRLFDFMKDDHEEAACLLKIEKPDDIS